MSKTAYITDSRVQVHTLHGHVESAPRLDSIYKRLAAYGLPERMAAFPVTPATDDDILTVHTAEYLRLLKWSEAQDGVQFGSDTYVLPESFGCARLSLGAALRGVQAVCSGEATNALVATRPPGHHAVPDMAMGFCLLANVAIAAKHAQTRYGVGRVMIVDYDLHHGNGTQAIFYDDPSVLFISTHQSPLYPGTGAIGETGSGDGIGATINLPLPVGVGDSGFAQAYQEVVWPAARRFAPDLILVSAGFDAHWSDPLGGLQLTLSGYAALTRELISMAGELCNGRIVFVQEGGYNLTALGEGMANIAFALLGDPTINDPMGPAPRREPDISDLLSRIKETHGL
jgi:acetoin utilization deacetylase AcuC-like enzyme